MKPMICPVCNGVGKVSAGFYNRAGDCPTWVSDTISLEVCRSCDGKGWVSILDDEVGFKCCPESTTICGNDRNLFSRYGNYC